MDAETARKLCDITSTFYRENASSFSSTRRASWAGWRRCLDEMGVGAEPLSDASVTVSPGGALPEGAALSAGKIPRDPLRVLDVACGNGRFLRFLQEALPGAAIAYFAVDDCEQLARDGLAGDADNVAFQKLDIANSLIDGSIERAIEAPPVDMAVCFGFFHHIPSADSRAALLRALVKSVRPGGHVAVSLWQFAKSPELAAKAVETTAKARVGYGLPTLDEGDYLLGWQNRQHAYRYCHTFSDGEVADLSRAVDGWASLVARFEADGRTGALNSYLVFRRRA
ncbi:MAG: class I SAM-dependent methyltransferase [Coriobacteriia bacterium]|nr:class I SAM-dependent methyltransferase [Coriobacteriia bacterium]